MTTDRKIYEIAEIFYSIQGEGHWTGRPAIFIRLAGCNLFCSFCDTDHRRTAFLDTSGILDRIEKELAALKNHSLYTPQSAYTKPMIVWTGGEPTLQLHEGDPTFTILRMMRFYQAIETNGTNPIELPFSWVTVSPKQSPIQIIGNEIKVPFDSKNPDYPLQFCITAFDHAFIQPIYINGDEAATNDNIKGAISFVQEHPQWRLSLQTQRFMSIK